LIVDFSVPCPSCGVTVPAASSPPPTSTEQYRDDGDNGNKRGSKRILAAILGVVIILLAAGGGFYYFQTQRSSRERAEAEAIRIEQERLARFAQERAAAVPVAVAGPEVQNALSARPEKVSYIMARLNDVGGMLRGVFSQANIDMIAPLVPPDALNQLSVAAAFASQIPAESLAFVFGVDKTDGITPFFQLAMSMPESVRPELDRMAAGEATPIDIVTLLLGRAALPFASFMEVASNHGARGPYYSFGIPEEASLVAAARNGLLLLALSSDDLTASIDALENAGNRLAVNRRFNTPDFYFLRLDYPTLAAMGTAHHEAALRDLDINLGALRDLGGPFSDLAALAAMPPPLVQLMQDFRAPWELEIAFEAQPGRFTVSSATNTFNVMRSLQALITEPATGANMFLAGSGRLFYAYAIPASFFNPLASDINPELTEMFRRNAAAAMPPGVTISDLENLLAGTLSVALGSDFTFMDMRVPGGYVALTGRSGAAARIFNALRSSVPPFISLQQLQVRGWDSLVMVNPNMFIPIPVIAGVSGETLFVGLLDPDGLGGTPEIPAEAARLFSEPAVYAGFIDVAAIWNLLRQELSDANSLLNLALMNLGPPNQNMAEQRRILLDSELSVPFIRAWAPDFETGFLEFTIADVPPGRCVLLRLLPLLTAAVPNPATAANFSAEASNTVSNLRMLQSASLMFFADNMNLIQADNPPATIVTGSRELALTPNPDLALLTQYTPNPDAPMWENFDFHFVGSGPIAHRAWWVSARVAEQGVRDMLVPRAASVGLFSAPHAPDNIGSPDYDGTTERVFLLVRNPR